MSSVPGNCSIFTFLTAARFAVCIYYPKNPLNIFLSVLQSYSQNQIINYAQNWLERMGMPA